MLQGQRWEGGTRAGPCPLLVQPHPGQELGGDKIPSPRGLSSAALGCAGTAGAGEGKLPALLSLALGGREGSSEELLVPRTPALSPSCT